MAHFCTRILQGLAVFFLLIALLRKPVLQNDVLRGTAPWAVAEWNYALDDIPKLNGKVMIVTGANVGLGKSTAKFLALKGATTILACRSAKKCSSAINEIIQEISIPEFGLNENDISLLKGRMIPMILDLNDLSSVKAFGEKFSGKFDKLDSLILNAGIMHTPFGLTTDGIEQQWGVNHLGHFFLVHLLAPKLRLSQPSRVVVVSSSGHFYSYDEGVKLKFEGPGGINDEASYNTVKAYGQSKLSNVLMAQELSRRFSGAGDRIYVNSLNPGAVNTELTRQYYPGFAISVLKSIVNYFPDVIAFQPDTAAMTQLYLSTSPEILSKKITGKYYVPIADPCTPSKNAQNITLQDKLWTFSEQILNDKGFFFSRIY